MVKTNILEITVKEINNTELTVSLCNSMLLPALLNADNHSSTSPHKEWKCQSIREGYERLPLTSSNITQLHNCTVWNKPLKQARTLQLGKEMV